MRAPQLALLASSLSWLGLTGCSPGGVLATDPCALAQAGEVREALGARVRETTREPHPQPGSQACVWEARDDGGETVKLAVAMWRARPDEDPRAERRFAIELRALEQEFGLTRIVGGLGEAAVIGLSPGVLDGSEQAGGVVVRDGETVLTLRASGGDPAALEALARTMVERL